MRATLPRIRYDQLMRLGWQALLPLSVLNLVATAVVIAYGLPWWVSGLFGLAVLLIAAAMLYARTRRAALPASTQADEAVPLALPSSVRLVRLASAANGTPTDSTSVNPAETATP
jgi:NADH-quinone oxidoreductase subunit H